MIAELKRVEYTKAEKPSSLVVGHVAIVMVMVATVQTFLEIWSARRFPWSIPSALHHLAMRPGDSVRLHLLRGFAMSCTLLYHFLASKWLVLDAMWSVSTAVLCRSGTAGFFAISFHLFFLRPGSTVRYGNFMPRFVRKICRQAAMSLVFFAILAPWLMPSRFPFDLADVCIVQFSRKVFFSEWTWLVMTETWHFF